MYIQSAEIKNFRGIRHLAVDFEKDTSVLIGENAWGKSSLLYALFMILGCGSHKRCQFAEEDLYVPIKLDSDIDEPSANEEEQDSNNDIDFSSIKSNDELDEKINALISRSRAASSKNDQTLKAAEQLTHVPVDAKFTNIVDHNTFKRLFFTAPSATNGGVEVYTVDAPNELYEKLKASHDEDYKEILSSFCDLKEDCSASERDPLMRSLEQGIEDDARYNLAKPIYNRTSPSDMLRHAQDFLAEQDSLNHEARRTAQEDVSFFSADVYQEKAEAIVIDLIFCEISHGVLNRLDRFEKLRPYAYESEDGRACIHYRVTAKERARPSDDNLNAKGSIPESDFVTIHELIDGKGQVIANSEEAIEDLITLNPLLRLRDRRMFNTTPKGDDDILDSSPDTPRDDSVQDAADTSCAAPAVASAASCDAATKGRCAQETNGAQSTANPDGVVENDGADHSELSSEDRSTISQIFSYMDEEDELNSERMSEAITLLNTIASKYLTNYQSSTQVYNKTAHQHPRTAREIVSHPVSVASLSSLKRAIADRKPSSTKFLLSMVAGALLMSKGERKFDDYARPILILEDIESRFHPTLLLNLWSILQVLPIQKIITTNSSQLIAAISLHNLRRLCKQYYDVRCYKVRDRAFSADDERKISFHVRMSRPASVFARCWILVEGETEVWMLNEIASVLDINLGCNGIKIIEFAQCGLNPLIKLARQLGIAFHVLTDGDTAGQHYAATVREFTGGRHLAEHLSVMPHVDIEHYLYASGFADVYQKAAGLTLKQVSERQMQSMMNKLGVSEIIAMANGGQPFEQIADIAATNLEQSSPAPYHKDHFANAQSSNVSRYVNVKNTGYGGHAHAAHGWHGQATHSQQGHGAAAHGKPIPPQNHNLESIIASIANVNFGANKQHLNNVLHRGKAQGKGKSAQAFDIKELTVNDVNMLYRYLRSLVEDMPRPSHNFTAKQSRMLKAIKAVCGVLSGIANTNKQRYASKLKKYERQKARNRNRASQAYHAPAQATHQHTHSRHAVDAVATDADIMDSYAGDQEQEFRASDLATSAPELDSTSTNADPSNIAAAEPADALPNTEELSDASRTDANGAANGAEDDGIFGLLSASNGHDNKEALLKIKAMADEAMMKETDHNRVKQFERSSGKAANAMYGALNDQELQRQGLNMNKVIEHAIKKNTKPGMAILVSEAMQKRGKDSVPLMFKTMFRKISRMASNELGIK